MRKIIAMAGALLCFMGCSNDNKIRIVNDAYGAITLNFRSDLETVYSGETVIIKDIPNGTYVGNATYTIPDGLKPGSLPTIPSLAFERTSSSWTLYFSSTNQDGTYNVFLNATTSDGTTITSPTSP
jgi:hypothetical protein